MSVVNSSQIRKTFSVQLALVCLQACALKISNPTMVEPTSNDSDQPALYQMNNSEKVGLSQKTIFTSPILNMGPLSVYYDPVRHFTGISESPRFSKPRYYSMTPYVVRDVDGTEYLFTCHK